MVSRFSWCTVLMLFRVGEEFAIPTRFLGVTTVPLRYGLCPFLSSRFGPVVFREKSRGAFRP